MKMHVDLQKRFPMRHVCSKCMAVLFCGSALQQNVLTFFQKLDGVEKTHVDWKSGNVHCLLIQHVGILPNLSCN